jgi:hypothetical protein
MVSQFENASIEAASADPFAVYIAHHFTHSDTEEKSDSVLQSFVILQTLRAFFPDKAAILRPHPDMTEQEVEDRLKEFYESFDWKRIWQQVSFFVKTHMPQFSATLDIAAEIFHYQPWLKNISQSKIRRARRIAQLLKNPGLDENERKKLERESIGIEIEVSSAMQAYNKRTADPALKELQLFLLAEKERKYGRKFANNAQLLKYERSLQVKEILEYIDHKTKAMPPQNRMYFLHETFARENLWNAFYEAVSDEIPNSTSKPLALSIYNQMIADFISTNQGGLWAYTPQSNFLFDIAQSHRIAPGSKLRTYAERVVVNLEKVIDDVLLIFGDGKDHLEFWDENLARSLTREQYGLRERILLHYEIELVERFLACNTTDYSKYQKHYSSEDLQQLKKERRYDADHPLVRVIAWREDRELFTKLGKRRRHLKRTNLDLIYGFEAYIQHAGIPSSDEIAHARPVRIYFKKFLDMLNDETSYDLLFPFIENYRKNNIRKLMQPFIEFVIKLRDARDAKDKFEPILGIGFSGQFFDEGELSHRENEISLAFSKEGRKEPHLLFLSLLIDYLRQENWETDAFPVQPKFTYYPAPYNSSGIDVQKDKLAYEYTLKQVMRLIFKDSPNSIHEEIRNIWIKLAKESVTKSNGKDKQALLDALDRLPLSDNYYSLLENLLLKDHRYYCAESMLSRYAHTNLYIPITFVHDNQQIIKLGDKPLLLGTDDKKRGVVPPCAHCQRLSSAYMLMSNLTQSWGVRSLDEIAKRSGKPSIPSRWASLKAKSHKATKKQANDNWYTNAHMQTLLEHYFGERDDIRIITPIEAYQLQGEVLQQNLNEATVHDILQESFGLVEVKHTLVPINLGNRHWVGLYIHYADDDRTKPTVGYFDPLGRDIPPEVFSAITAVYTGIHSKAEIISSPIRLQNDSYNCGPWVIAILQSLVETGSLPSEDFDISIRRQQDEAILGNLEAVGGSRGAAGGVSSSASPQFPSTFRQRTTNKDISKSPTP